MDTMCDCCNSVIVEDDECVCESCYVTLVQQEIDECLDYVDDLQEVVEQIL